MSLGGLRISGLEGANRSQQRQKFEAMLKTDEKALVFGAAVGMPVPMKTLTKALRKVQDNEKKWRQHLGEA